MNRDEIKGKIDEIKGEVKQRIGGARGDAGQQGEGWLEKQKGKLQGGVGKVEKETDRREPDEADEK